MFYHEYHIYFTHTAKYLDISDPCYSTHHKYAKNIEYSLYIKEELEFFYLCWKDNRCL